MKCTVFGFKALLHDTLEILTTKTVGASVLHNTDKEYDSVTMLDFEILIFELF